MGRKKKQPYEGIEHDPLPVEVTYDPPEPDPELESEPMLEPEPVQPKKVVELPPARPRKEGVTLDLFLRVCGKRFDQMAGFRRYAINQKMPVMSVAEWREEYRKFMALPV